MSTDLQGELVAAGTGSVAVREGPTRERIAAAWLVAQESENTQAAYRRDITEFFAWCDQHSLAALSADRVVIDAYLRYLATGGTGRRLANSTIARKLSSLSSFYRYGLDEHEDVVPGNPVDRVKRPKVEAVAQPDWLTRDEFLAVLQVADAWGPWWGALVRIMAYTGIRVSELCGARTCDLKVIEGEMTLAVAGMGNLPARLVLPADAAEKLAEQLAGRTGALFLDRRGRPVNRQQVRYQLDKLVKAAGIVGSRSVRTTCNTPCCRSCHHGRCSSSPRSVSSSPQA